MDRCKERIAAARLDEAHAAASHLQGRAAAQGREGGGALGWEGACCPGLRPLHPLVRGRKKWKGRLYYVAFQQSNLFTPATVT
eukprot:359702-Chlamydomonas_euryale.AAC.4